MLASKHARQHFLKSATCLLWSPAYQNLSAHLNPLSSYCWCEIMPVGPLIMSNAPDEKSYPSTLLNMSNAPGEKSKEVKIHIWSHVDVKFFYAMCLACRPASQHLSMC